MIRLANPWLTVLLYAVAVPVVVYLAVLRALHFGEEGRIALAIPVSLGGVSVWVA